MVFAYNGSRDPVRQLRREMDRLFNGFAGDFPMGNWPWGGRGQPPVNVWENADAVMVEMEVPGVKSEQVDISVVGNELTIKVERPTPEQADMTFHRQERPTGSFTRTLRLPVAVAADNVEAQLHNGVLAITLPKAQEARPRKIQVTSK